MRFINHSVPARSLVMALSVLAGGSIAAPQSRITSLVKPEQRITIAGTTSPLLKRSIDHGRLPGGQNLGRMVLLLAPTVEQEQDAEQFVASQHDPSSVNFHKWLTPAEYGKRFGIADEDAAQVQQWLQNQGLTVHEVSQSRRFVVFSGTVSQVESAFSTEMHAYDYKSLKFIANATETQIPTALQPVVKGVVRLHSDPRQNNARMGSKFTVNRKTGNIEGPFGLHFLGPADFATIYNVQPLYDAGINGAGETIAIVSRSSLVDANYGIDGVQDIRDFRNVMGLPPNDPEVIINGDDPGVISYGDTQEAMLDVTWAGAVAPMAHIKVVASQSNFADGVDASAAYIVDHNLAPIMSTSFGSCEQNMGTLETAFFNSLWQQAAAQGITAFVSAGDNGGAGCDDQGSGQYAYGGLAVNGIASTPYNVAVGGTQFDDTDKPDTYWSVASDPTTLKSVLSYIPEKVWNESDNDPFFTSLWAGSGGISTLYAKPAWQAAPGVPNDGKRDLPDFSLAAAIHTGYAVCFLGYCSDPNYVSFYTFGGTSAASPAAAGIMALVLQKMGGQPQGMANYVFYRLASVPGVYHDITKGDNKVPDSNGQYTVGYGAGTGYDLASGLGSFDANALVNNWQAAAAALGSSTTLSLANGQASNFVHGTPVVFHARVACSGAGCAAPTGPVSLIATSATGDVTGVGAAPLVPGVSKSTATIATAEIPGGSYGVAANYGGDGNYYASSSNSVNVTVSPEPSQMLMGGYSTYNGAFLDSPLTVSYAEPVTLYIAVAGNSGHGHPTGQISLLVDGAAPNTVTRNFVSPASLTLNYGESSTVFGNGKALTGQSSVMPNLSSGFAAGTHQVQASYAGDNSFNGSTANYSFTVSKEDSLISDVFLVGTAVPNVPVNVAGQIVLANNGCAPYGGTVTITDYTSGNPVTIASGNADQLYCDSFSFPVTFPTSGNHLIRVNFSGDSNVNGSTSTGYLTVNSNTYSYVNLSADTASVFAGSPVTLMAQVGSDVRQYAATGSVTFLDGQSTLGSGKLDLTGTATLIVKTLAAGTHNITASYSGDAVLQASSGGPWVETVADYVLQAQLSTISIPAGQSGSTTINILPLGGSTQTVQLSCAALPVDVSCSFSPASVTLDGINPGAAKVTVSTQRMMAVSTPGGRVLGVASTLAFTVILLPLGLRRRWKKALGFVALILVALYGVACGSSGNSNVSKQGVYAITISGASAGTQAKSTSLVVVITH